VEAPELAGWRAGPNPAPVSFLLLLLLLASATPMYTRTHISRMSNRIITLLPPPQPIRAISPIKTGLPATS